MLLTEILAFRSRLASPISSPAWHWRRRSAKWLRSTDPSPPPPSFAISPSVPFFFFLLDLCYNSSFLLLRQENYKMNLFLFFSLVSGSVLNGGDSAPSPDWTPSMWADMVDGYQQPALSSRLGIPMIYGTDAVHGHNNVFGSTVFPHNIGLGATRYKKLEFVPFLVGCVWMYRKLHFWNHQSRDLKLRLILIWFFYFILFGQWKDI